MAIFFNFSPTSSHLRPLQVENCDSNSRLVLDEDDNGKFKLESVDTNGSQALTLYPTLLDLHGSSQEKIHNYTYIKHVKKRWVPSH